MNTQRKTKKRPGPVDQLVGRRIKELREYLKVQDPDKYLIKNLAAAAGVSYQQMQRYENGENGIMAGVLYEIAKFLEVPVGVFFEAEIDIQAVANGDAKLADTYSKAISRPENIKLMLLFAAITDPKLKRTIFDFVEELYTHLN